MDNKLFELAEWSIKTAKSAGADECRINISSERFVEIGYRKRKPETIKEASTKGLNIEIFVNGRYSNQSTSDLRKEALTDFYKNAVKMTKLLAEDPFRSLPDKKYYEKLETINLELFDPEIKKITPEERHALVKSLEDACLKKGGDKVISVEAGAYDSSYENVMVTSNGFSGSSSGTVLYISADMTAKDEGDRKPNGYDYAVVVKKDKLPDPVKVGENAAIRTLNLFGGKKIQSEKLPIIIENRGVSRVLGGFISAMFGRGLQQKQSFLLDKKGQKIGSDKLTLIDDPYIIQGQGSKFFDNDGFKTKKRVMIDSGVLKEYYVDWYYSRKLNCEPTTGSTSNIIIPPGNRSVEEIMKDLKRGVFITDFIGGNSNSTTGDFSVGIFGKLFDNGEIVQSVAEMNIAGNHLEFWNKLAEVGNDPYPYSSWCTPSMVFTDVMVSGV
jgi:PmbA protein